MEINGSMATPIAGERLSLTCRVFGATATAYQWRVNDSVIQDEVSMTLSLSPFNLSNTGWYCCKVNVTEDNMIYAADENITVKSK